MRSKALLVGARAGFVGPWVNIEEGEWVVAPPSSISLDTNGITAIPCDVEVGRLGGGLVLYGPGKIRACVDEKYDGKDVYLKVKQVA